MKFSVSGKLNSGFLDKLKGMGGRFSRRLDAFSQRKKDDFALVPAIKEVNFSDDDYGEEELQRQAKEQEDNNLNSPEVEAEPQITVSMPNSVEDVYSVPSESLDETIIEIGKTLKKLNAEQERLTQIFAKAQERRVIASEGKMIIDKIIKGEDFNGNIDAFEAKLVRVGNIHASVKDFLIESQKRIKNDPRDKRYAVVFEFSQNDRLLRYIKALYGFKCQICGFTFEQEGGSLYAETYYLDALSDGGADSLDNIIVLCPNHHKMFEYANVSIRYATTTEVSVEINGRQHIIKRIPLQ